MNPANWLVRSARLNPGNPAILDGTRQLADYRQFLDAAAATARALRSDFGIGPGDRVALFAGNTPQYLIAMWGIWFAGAVAVPVNAKLHPKEAGWIIGNAGASTVFTTPGTATGIGDHLPDNCVHCIDLSGTEFERMCAGSPLAEPVERSAEDLAWLFYTSGTTGRPKGVMIPNRAIIAMATAYIADVDSVYPDDTAFYAAPLSHGAGIYNFMHVIRAARHSVPPSGGFDPAEIFEHARRLGNLHMFAAPTMVKRLVEHARANGETGEGIRTIVYGGGPMYVPDMVEAVEVLGSRFVQIYGQGESPMCITALAREHVIDRSHPRWRERLASVGTAQLCVEVRIADAAGSPLPPGNTGEILVRGPTVMNGYWDNPGATDETLRGGWLWTGDMGELDDDGFLTLKDRSKDMIISGGTNIYPREVEEVLLTHPAVLEVSVVGKPDTEWGEIVCAFVVVRPGATVETGELDAHCVANIARFKRPKEYRFTGELPKNNYGKVLKTELRKRLSDK